ncbi:predicted protein [Uncinocarpus reesii 1704]|uniref:F-box domain-containing protein n=1 Tax=Uncinocarpus reesii (strain UAMH 1704) TaxID=336963 RepID=C4JUU7_UNCRE|nr:uncharacterized protein UREG_04900 [Uncinocarpus reesii 1704]EEP80058.1 predicted protein [Uncinocarpus reesii 1704]
MTVILKTPAQASISQKNEEGRRDLTRFMNQLGSLLPSVYASDVANGTESTLGTLEVFPLEVLHMILSGLDIQSLSSFRAANRSASTVVKTISKYTSLYTLAPSVFQAVVSFGAGSWITCEELRATLSSDSCATCGGFGSFIYLYTCKRVCPECITRDPEYPTALVGFVKYLCDLDEKTLGKLRTITIPEKRACPDELHQPLQLINRNDALSAGLSLHGACSLLLKFGGEESDDDGDDLGYDEDACSTVVSCAFSDKADLISGITFYAGAVRAPQVDFTTGSVEWGTCCSACRDSGRHGRGKMEWDEEGAEKYANYIKECSGAMTILAAMDYCQHVARSAAVGYVPMVSEE